MTDFKNWCIAHNMAITDTQLEKFAAYKENLLEWNKKFNLTAITDEPGIWQKHFADSLTLLATIDELTPGTAGAAGTAATLIDVGTGAGFPGIPVKIMRPQIEVTLVDSLRKRCTFLQDTITKLALDNIEVHHSRAEDFLKINGGRRYGICTARAVAKLERLIGWCMPLVKPGGFFIAMKGGEIEAELAAAEGAMKKAEVRLHDVRRVELAEGIGRVLVVVAKIPSNETAGQRRQTVVHGCTRRKVF